MVQSSEQPTESSTGSTKGSTIGQWLKRLSYLAILGFPLSVLGSRLGVFDLKLAFAGIRYTLFLALAVFVVGILVAFFQRQRNPDSSKSAKAAVLISLIPLLGIGSQLYAARSVPPIHNITTDTVEPPSFVKIREIRGESHNPLEYDAAKLAPIQLEAYPDVKTLLSQKSPEQAFSKALEVVDQMGWELVSQEAGAGIIEATETTALWAFKDDVVIRIEATDSGSKIDLRSVSRVGQSDIGANAKRIKKFLNAFQK